MDLLYNFVWYISTFSFGESENHLNNSLKNWKSYIFTFNISEPLEYSLELNPSINIIFLYIYMKDIENRKFKNILTLSEEDIDDVDIFGNDLMLARGMFDPYSSEQRYRDPHIRKISSLLSKFESKYILEYVLDNVHKLQK